MKLSGPLLTDANKAEIERAISVLERAGFTIRAGAKSITARMSASGNDARVSLDITPLVGNQANPVNLPVLAGAFSLSFADGGAYEMTITAAATLTLTDFFPGGRIVLFIRTSQVSNVTVTLPSGLRTADGATTLTVNSASRAIMAEFVCIGDSISDTFMRI